MVKKIKIYFGYLFYNQILVNFILLKHNIIVIAINFVIKQQGYVYVRFIQVFIYLNFC